MQTPLIVFNARLKARRPRTATLTYVALVVAEPDMVVVDDLGAAVTHRSLIDVVTIASPGLHSLPDDAAPLTPGIDRPRRSLFNTLSGLRGHRARPGRECGGPRTGGPPASKEQAEGVAVGVNHHSDPVLRLEVGQARAVGLRPVHRGGQVVDMDVEVLGGGLLSLLGRPHWALEAPLVFEVEPCRDLQRRAARVGNSHLLGQALHAGDVGQRGLLAAGWIVVYEWVAEWCQ